jgi:hypothetical protein
LGRFADLEDRCFSQLLDKGSLDFGHHAGDAVMKGMRHLVVVGHVVGFRRSEAFVERE